MSEPVIRFFGKSDVGRKRDHNEDRYHFSEIYNYAILADGMGGRHFGEVAAEMTVETVKDKFENYFPSSIDAVRDSDQGQAVDMVVCLLDEWIRDANFQVWDRGQKDERFREMGTTLAMVYALPTCVVVAHIGDSRVYHLHEGALTQVTSDHSFVNSQVATGAMTAEEAQASSQKNIITRAIGTHRNVKPEFKIARVAKGDRLLLCSDGLSDMVSDDQIAILLGQSKKGDLILDDLVAAANEAGGRDNITVLMVDYSG
ncbi:MAG: Stp1/IreP family PP2C-type Ser/Thr phosphatase [Planctomycetes bacterium]|nr:Stp1/IreP family PP2C-type Ser/Thr phosphatase [Planctomycetota bacterium]